MAKLNLSLNQAASAPHDHDVVEALNRMGGKTSARKDVSVSGQIPVPVRSSPRKRAGMVDDVNTTTTTTTTGGLGSGLGSAKTRAKAKSTTSVEVEGMKTQSQSQLQRKRKSLGPAGTAAAGAKLAARSRDPFEIPVGDDEDGGNEEAAVRAAAEPPAKRVKRLGPRKGGREIQMGSVDLPPPSPVKGSAPATARSMRGRKGGGVSLSDVGEMGMGTGIGITSSRLGRGRPRKIAAAAAERVRSDERLVQASKQDTQNEGDREETPEEREPVTNRVEEAQEDDQRNSPVRPHQRTKRESLAREVIHQLPTFWKTQRFTDFETQASIFSCRAQWKEMLRAARFNRASVDNPATTTIESVEGIVRKTCEYLDGDGKLDKDKAINVAHKALEKFKLQTSNLSANTEAKSNLLRDDLFTVAIPSLVLFLKKLVDLHFTETGFSYDALVAIVETMRVTLRVCSTAADWRPRPTHFDGPVLGDTRNKITANLRRLFDEYRRQRDILGEAVEAEARYAEGQRERVKLQEAREREAVDRRRRLRKIQMERERWHAERLEEDRVKRAEIEKKREENRARRALREQRTRQPYGGGGRAQPLANDGYNRAGSSVHKSHAAESPANAVVDIDNLDLHLQYPWNRPSNTTTHQPPTTSNPTISRTEMPQQHHPDPRPHFTRQPTEDIPAPTPTKPEWTDAEMEALISGLERHTGPDRFQRILDDDARLRRRDMDEVVLQAGWLRRVMAGSLEEGGYEWLRSVPG